MWRITLILICSIFVLHPLQAQNESEFGYVYQSEQGKVILAILSPNVTTIPLEEFDISIDPSWIISSVAEASPHSQVAIAFQTQEGNALLKVDLTTNTAEALINNIRLAPAPSILLGSQSDFVWSPNGTYLAFNLAIYDAMSLQNTNTLLYSLQDHAIIELTDDDNYQTTLSWSNDSQRLAIATANCTTQPCTASLDIYNVQTLERTVSIAFDTISGANVYTRAGVCFLEWSPDDRFISFLASCDASSTGVNREIYLLDVSSGVVVPITTYTSRQNADQQNGVKPANYQEPLWIDAENLLISSVFGIDRSSETAQFNVTTNILTPISEDFVSSWAVSPITGELAFTSSSANLQLDPFNQYQLGNVEISESVNDLELDVSSSVIRGCNISWSPNGTTLQYVIPENNDCRNQITGFGFIDAVTRQDNVYLPSYEVEPLIVIPIGWLN